MTFEKFAGEGVAAFNHSNSSGAKKTGRRKLNSPPGLKLLVWNYEIAP
jgi:hypothetical protein